MPNETIVKNEAFDKFYLPPFTIKLIDEVRKHGYAFAKCRNGVYLKIVEYNPDNEENVQPHYLVSKTVETLYFDSDMKSFKSSNYDIVEFVKQEEEQLDLKKFNI